MIGPSENDGNHCIACGNDAAQVTENVRRCASCGFVSAAVLAPDANVVTLDSVDRLGPGTVLRGRYRLVHPIGAGAHGITYLAEHLFLNHRCVVKLLPERVSSVTDEAVRRMRAEAAIGLQLSVPSLIRVLDFDSADGVWFFVMEYVDGVDLQGVLKSGPVPWRQAANFARDIAMALCSIHGAGLIHRDIKPSNLILDRSGRIRVGDLGLVGFDGGQAGEMIAGTLPYAAPESFDAECRLDGRADLYSLGATLYELLVGSALPGRDSLIRAMLEPHRAKLAWPESAPEVPEWLRGSVLKLLEPDREARPGSAAELLAELDRHLPRSEEPRIDDSPAADTESEPTGIVVTGFEAMEHGADESDWYGLALAESLGRMLTSFPSVYAPDRDEFARVLERVRASGVRSRASAIVEAGRLIGAAAILQGHYRFVESQIELSIELIRAGSEPMMVGPIAGSRGEWPAVLESLLERIRPLLQLVGTAHVAGRIAPGVAAQERFYVGKRAYLYGDYEEAARLGREAITLDPDFAEAIGFVGVCCAKMGRYAEAAEYHERQQAIAEQRGDVRLGVEARANMGAMHYFRGEYDAALMYFSQAAEVADRDGLRVELAKIHNNLGFVYLHLGRLRDAESAYRGAIATHRAHGAIVSLIGPYNGLGNVLREQGRYEEAEFFHRRALALAREADDQVNVGIGHMYIGRCASLRGGPDEAKHHLAMALNTLEATRFWNGLARLYESMVETNLQLGDADEALRCADKRIELARRHSNRRMEAAAWRQKAAGHRLAGRLKEAGECELRAEELAEPRHVGVAVAS